MPSGTGHDPDRLHLFIICTDANDQKEHLLVSISKWRNDFCDPTCILEPGCHAFVRHKSWVMYRSATIETSDTLMRGVGEGILQPRDCLDANIYKSVEDGILKSPHTPRKFKTFYKKQISGND